MEFVELSEKEYRKYWETHPLKSFLSSPEIGKLRKKNGWNVVYLGLKENNNLVAATLLVSQKRHFNRLEFYAPRGFLLDFNDENILSIFTKNIKDYIKKQKGYVLRIDPYVLYQQRNLDGEIVEDGWNNKQSVQNLEKLGYKKVQIKDMEQVGWMFSLNLEGKTEKEYECQASGLLCRIGGTGHGDFHDQALFFPFWRFYNPVQYAVYLPAGLFFRRGHRCSDGGSLRYSSAHH